MSKEAIYKRVTKVVREQRHDTELFITSETSLRDDLEVDSIELMEFVIALEDEFGIAIPDEDVDQLDNIKDLIDYLDSRTH